MLIDTRQARGTPSLARHTGVRLYFLEGGIGRVRPCAEYDLAEQYDPLFSLILRIVVTLIMHSPAAGERIDSPPPSSFGDFCMPPPCISFDFYRKVA